MSATFDPKQYLAEFVLEAHDHLATFEALLTQAERQLLEGHAPEEGLVHRLFRAVHTLKGMAGMLGFSALVTLSHEIEAVLDEVRSGRRLWPREVAALLEVSEVLEQLLERVATTGREDGVDVLPSQATLLALARGELAERPVLDLLERLDPHDQVAVLVDVARGQKLYNVKLIQGEPASLASVGRLLGAWNVQGKLVMRASPDAPADVLLLAHEGLSHTEIQAIGGAAVVSVDDAPLPWATPPTATPARVLPREEVAKRLIAIVPPPPSPAVRVEASRLERLSALVAALGLDHARLAEAHQDLANGQAVARKLTEALAAADDHTQALASELAQARRVAAGALFGRFTRPVRELARATGKAVRLEMLGVDVLIDRDIAESLLEPLMHLVRNAVDHGLEPATERQAQGKQAQGVITLGARLEGHELSISVSDDGRGIDREAVLARARAGGLVGSAERPPDAFIDALIFHPGLSTAPVVTDVSGRGVGMDAVRASIAKLSGRIDVSSHTGRGMRVVLTVVQTVNDGRVEDPNGSRRPGPM